MKAYTYDDIADIVVYDLRSSTDNGLEIFSINETSGEITVQDDSTDAETVNEYTLVVEAQDRRFDPIR